jgi:hypothetical protein
MSLWLYQMNQEDYPPSRYRLDIWEGRLWHWEYGNKYGNSEPISGDRIIFYYTPSKGDDPGIYGWAIITSIFSIEKQIYFMPVDPSDKLKMYPWTDREVIEIINEIRPVNQGTLFQIDEKIKHRILTGIIKWVNQINQASNPRIQRTEP